MAVTKKHIRGLARLHGYWIYKTFLTKTAEWPLELKRAWVYRKTRDALITAYEGTEFYRKRFDGAGFDPRRHFDRVEDLARVPMLTKEEVRRNYEEMIDRRFLATSVVAYTSGTSGQPTEFRLNEYYVAFDYACMFRHWALSGYRFRSRIAALRSYVPSWSKGPLWKYNRWQNALFMSAYHLKAGNAEDYIEELIRFRPQYIRAYPSSINVLAEFAYPFREQLRFVRGIFTASETLLESERANIERTFGKVVYDWYGMTEPAVVITERADHNGLDVNWEYGYPEFLEGPELTGNQRHLLATSLHNPVMPFIRYQTGDVVSLGAAEQGGDLYPRIQSIQGRKDECFLTPDGRRLPSLNFYSLLQAYREILRFQFVQAAADEVQLRLLLRPGGQNIEGVLKTVRIEVGHRLGPEMKLLVEIADTFVTSPDGKTPTFVRRI